MEEYQGRERWPSITSSLTLFFAPSFHSEFAEETPYLFLSVDLPPPPLFRDEFKESIIPQVPLFQILTKFDGQTAQEQKTYKDNFLKRYEIRKLPPYLILCFRVSDAPSSYGGTRPFLSILAFYKEHVLSGEEPHDCQFSYQVRSWSFTDRCVD